MTADTKNTTNKPAIIPVILCGGSGTRLWPASQDNHPKQFLTLTNELSLLQNTVRRALSISGAPLSSLVIVTLDTMADKIIAQIDNPLFRHILSEPCPRNTGAAVAFAASYVAQTFGDDALMWILPADHHIGDEAALADSFENAVASARDGNLVTFGIAPTRPDTGYGYIRAARGSGHDKILAVEEFVEKPDSETAKQYLTSGSYLWNSGMFLFSTKTVLDEFTTHAPYILKTVQTATKDNPAEPDGVVYADIESKPFDKAIMEQSSRVTVVPSNPGWSDIGSWESLWDIRGKDENNNVIEGNALAYNSRNSLIQSRKKLIAVAGLDSIVVVETEDAILIMNKSDNDSMKELVKQIKDRVINEQK